MFVDELENALKDVPYNVWEKVVGMPVDKVKVERYAPIYCGEQDQVVVGVYSGINRYVLKGFGCLDEKHEVLLRCWKPYRDLISEELESFNSIMSLQTEFEEPTLTENEFDNRLEDICFSLSGKQLYSYINIFNLKSVLKDRVYSPDLKDIYEMERRVNSEAFGIILKMISGIISGDDYPDLSEEVDVEAKKLADYCREAIGDNEQSDDNQKTLQKVLKRFLEQKLSIDDIYDQVDYILDSVKTDNDMEDKFCEALGVYRSIKHQILNIDEDFTKGGRFGLSCFYARGFKKGVFYGMCEVLYILFNEGSILEIDRRKKNLIKKSSDPEVLEILFKRIERNAKEYEKESRKQFEDFEVVITEEKYLEHDSFYTAEISEYGIALTGYDKDELIKIIKEQFKDKQSEYLIRKYLRLDE